MPESHNSLNADRLSPQLLQSANEPDHQHTSLAAHPGARAYGRVVLWRVCDLKPHPRYAQLGVKIPASRFNELLELGEDAFAFPLFVTSTGIVIEGYARLEVARLQGRGTIECVEYDISEQEALRVYPCESKRQ